MSEWFYRVTSDPTDMSPLVDALAYFENEYLDAQKEIATRGSLEKNAARIPGIVEYRFSQLQELEALVVWIDDEFKKVKHAAFKKYFEAYNKTLSSRDADKYADADPKVLEIALLQNQICLVRNKYQGIVKGLEAKQYQINNIVRLRCAGLEDAEINW